MLIDHRSETIAPPHEAPAGAQAQTRSPSLALNLVLTAAVALICGVLGAMGYAHFIRIQAWQDHRRRIRPAESGSNEKSSTNGKPAGGPAGEEPKNASSRASTIVIEFRS